MANNTNVPILMTPQHFLSLYNIIYQFDKDIVKIKEIAFILSTIFMTLGIFDNIICIYAFLQDKLLEKKFNWYLLITSVFKLIFCITLISDYICLKIHHKFLHDLNKIVGLLIDFVIHTSDSCIALLTVFLSLDRLYAIRHPLKLKDFFTNLHAKYLISSSLCIFIVLVIFNVALCEQNLGSNSHIIYCTIVSPTILNTLPLIIILILNILLVRETIKKYYKNKSKKNSIISQGKNSLVPLVDLKVVRRRRSSVRQSIHIIVTNKHQNTKKDKSHFFVIVTDIWSFLTSTPYYILNSYYILFHLNIFSMETIIILQIISSVLFNSNYCINFFIYLSFYAEFRNIVTAIFMRLILRKKRSPSITSL